MNIIAVTQVRLGSSRLPNKVLQTLGKNTALDLHLKRVRQSKLINKFIVASTFEDGIEKIKEIAEKRNFLFSQGDLSDVLDRFYQATKNFHPDFVVRLTSDCPLIDPHYIDDLITKFLDSKADYASNALEPSLPDGMDAEIFRFEALELAWKEARKKSEREHVTPYIRDCGKFKILSVNYPHSWASLRMTLDTAEDLQFLKELVAGAGEDATLETYIDYLEKHKELCAINSKYFRNEGFKKSLSED